MNTPSKFEFRPFDKERDFDKLLALRAASGDSMTAESLKFQLEWPSCTRSVIDHPELGDKLIGECWTFAQTSLRTIVFVIVEPEFRRQGIGSKLLDHGIDIANENGAEQIVSGADKINSDADVFLNSKGFEPAGNTRKLIADRDTEIPDIGLPEGFSIRSYDELADLAPIVEACNRCYSDMWGHAQNTSPSTVESFKDLMERLPDYHLPEAMLVLFDPNKRIAGIVFGRIQDSKRILDSPAIAPEFRSENLLKPLCCAVMRIMQDMSDGEYVLYSWGDEEIAIDVFEELGFHLALKDHFVEYLLKS